MKALVISFVFLGEFVYGSIPRPDIIPQVENVLKKKTDSKFADLQKLGPEVYGSLRRITFDTREPMNMRWNAFMAMVRLGEKQSLPEVKEALKSRDWYLRDAAIRVLPLLDKEAAYKASISGLKDRAMVVRTAAVDSLGRLKRPEASSLLWSQLYSKDNYIHKQSLWIRRHIVEALAELAPKGSEEKFLKVLDDSDSALFAPAILGLEKVTGKKLGDPLMPSVYRRYLWKDRFKKKS